MDTLFIGQKIIELHTVDSTNSYAIELLKKESLPEGTLIWSKNQTSGRGQRGNKWDSEPFKNGTFSIILKPSFLPVDEQFYLNKIVSLAVADFVSDILKNTHPNNTVAIKWPNDIYVGDKKLAGILIENSLRNNHINNSVIGIGININQTQFNSNVQNPISLKLICENDFNIENCIAELCSYFEARYLQLKSNHLEKINKEYEKKLYRYGEWANFSIGEKVFKARITGISKEGMLIIETPDAKKHDYGFKEIASVI